VRNVEMAAKLAIVDDVEENRNDETGTMNDKIM
jgi:hypothetical protein